MKANKFLTFMVIFLLLIILTGCGLLAYKYFFFKDRSYLGTWSREIDLRGYVMEEMNEWFNDPTTSANVVYDNTKVVVKVDLTFTKDGKFVEKIDEASFSEAKTAAKELALSGLISFLEIRMENAGIEKGSVEKTVDELIEEALEMSASDYLEKKGPELLPTVDSLKEMYDLSGTYEAKDSSMKRTSGGKSICETYFTKDDLLVFTGLSDDTFGKGLAAPMGDESADLKMLYDYPAVYTRK